MQHSLGSPKKVEITDFSPVFPRSEVSDPYKTDHIPQNVGVIPAGPDG
jgi:hypothetical protein